MSNSEKNSGRFKSSKLKNDFDKFRVSKSYRDPVLHSTDPSSARRKIVEEVLPEGAFLSDQKSRKSANYWGGSSGFGGNGGSSMFHTQKPYLPEFDSPDRQWYPEDQVEANKNWRLFYKSDPIFGTAIDMYSTMMTSDFDIVLENTQDSSIKNQLELMCETVNFQNVFQNIVKEFLTIGEAFPHCFFDNNKGIWTHVGFHDPDYMEVIDSPIIDMDPLLYFVPPEELKELLTDTSPESLEIRQRLPVEFVSKVLANQKIRISPLNGSFIPRKMHPYDIRGTSLGSRLWRINMVEDAVYNSTIATYRRAAAPVKVLKLGDPATGWMPPPEAEKKLLDMVTQAELDPQAYVVYNYGVNFETWGNTDRAITIKQEYDTIEKIKLVAMGLSKSFMTGEISYASAKSGLQVFLRRLLSMRQFFEAMWVYPKFFGPIIEANDWNQRSTTAEVSHRIRVKRTAQQAFEKGTLVTPKIKWKNRLDSAVDEDLLRALLQLKNFGFDVSMSTVGSTLGLDWESEQKKKAEEFLKKDQILTDVLGETQMANYKKENPAAPGASGSGAKPAAGGAPAGSKPPEGGGTKEVSTPPGNSEDMGPSDESIENPKPDSIG
jgi:hypothetical protein